MKSTTFASTARQVAATPTVYMWGAWGNKVDNGLITRKSNQYPNQNNGARVKLYKTLVGKGYEAWDCTGLIKGILWGWQKGKSPVYGSNGVPDNGSDTMFKKCTNISTDFKNIAVGEAVWMPGHIGIFVGNDEVAEATPSWKDGVQITKLAGRGWTKHGKLPWVEYVAEDKPNKPDKPNGSVTHTVVKGDTPWSLAKKYLGNGNKYPQIMELNGLSKTAHIYVGQVLAIPSTDYRTHKVVKGDTPWGLAVKYLGKGSRYTEIMALNSLAKNADIYVGQILRIPNK